ncbi:B12-binding domain-containing radical SAM protein [Magnetovibrio sp.]|uniref:B12-binding domain-containing radical SAM protein n=1 Tax=Magnetovibrio sp. TaxID=2024836 RepID=UPI002F924E7A
MSPSQYDTLPHDDIGPKKKLNKTVWLIDPTYTQQQVSAELIPYAMGLLACYAEKCIDFDTPVRIFKYPEKLVEAIAQDGAPDIIGFSHFVWNGYFGYEFAKRLKEISPQIITIFGGPSYPVDRDEQVEFLEHHPEIDFYVIKEGEVPFVRLLQALIDADFNADAVKQLSIPSVHAIDAAGKPFLGNSSIRLRDLTVIPSPYLTGRLDEFFDGTLLPIMQVRRGCPFGCTYCVEGDAFYTKVTSHAEDKIEAELNYIGAMMEKTRGDKGRNDLSIADSNFGMYKGDVGIAKAIASVQEKYNFPEYIHVAMGKNQKHRILEVAGMVNGALRLSGSVQTLDPTALENVNRANISTDEMMVLALEGRKIDANSYSEVILGLPGETKEGHFHTLRTLMEAGFNRVITYQLMMLPGSELATRATIEKHGMELRYRVLPRCFGHFDVAGKRINAAEVEGICVSNNTLSFEEYLECRRMHLMISVFHNDAVFGTLLKFLKSLGVPIFRWLELLSETEPEGRLKQLLADFMNDTSNELWTDREALEAFIQEGDTVERYIKGEIGNNLMLTYKAYSMTEYLPEIRDHAKTTAQTLLREIGKDTPENVRFVDEAVDFDASKMSNIWQNNDQVITGVFNYDIARFSSEIDVSDSVNSYLLNQPTDFQFVLQESQKQAIERNLAVFGNDFKGIARALTKTHTKKLLRQPLRVDA